jgi:NAD(P)-dependent dehydrogenase (short-subunit alcohol dehydrogenase family)
MQRDPGLVTPDLSQVPDYSGMLRLDGRTFVVIGSGQGIGRQTAHALAQAGACVMCADREAVLAETVAREIDGVPFACDATNREEVESLFRHAKDELGQVNGIVDIVGMAKLKPLAQFTDLEWNWQFDVVLRHMFLALQLGAPAVAEGGGGPLIFVGSISGDLCVPAETVYGSAKAAQHHLVRSAALEYAKQRLRINAVSPGFTRTPRLLQLFGAANWQQIDRAIPAGTAAMPADMASVILFLASDLGQQIIGQVITVDGGLSLSGAMPPMHPITAPIVPR